MSRLGLLFAIVSLCAMSMVAWATGPEGLLAEWNFDEGKGDVARDSSGNGRDAKIYGATWVKQGDGFALSLDGFDDYVDCGMSADIGISGPVSMEVWIKPSLIAHGEARVFGESYSTYVLTYYVPDICNWYIGGGGSGNWNNAGLKVNEWNHVLVTFDGEQISMWVNGQGRGSRNAANKTYKPGGRFFIGTKGGTDSPRFKGMLDRVRVYNRPLSGKEALAHFKAEIDEYRDPTWASRVRVTPFYYLERGEIVIEADYNGLLPLEGKGRLEGPGCSCDT